MYRELTLNSGVVKVWHAVIGHLEFSLAAQAFKRHMQNSTFEPRTADIIRNAREISNPKLLTAGEAWSVAVQLVKRYGTAGHAEALERMKDEPQIVRVLTSAMWKRICHSDLEREISFVERDFRSDYEDTCEQHDEERKTIETYGKVTDLVRVTAEKVALPK